jgi:hypothetical protein
MANDSSEAPSREAQRSELGAVCEHGSLKRSCLICELQAERDSLKSRLADLEARAEKMGRVVEAAKFLINFEGCKTKLEKDGVTEKLKSDKNWTGQALYEPLESLGELP